MLVVPVECERLLRCVADAPDVPGGTDQHAAVTSPDATRVAELARLIQVDAVALQIACRAHLRQVALAEARARVERDEMKALLAMELTDREANAARVLDRLELAQENRQSTSTSQFSAPTAGRSIESAMVAVFQLEAQIARFAVGGRGAMTADCVALEALQADEP